VLLADPDAVAQKAAEMQIDLSGVQIVNPADADLRRRCAERLYDLRWRKGVTHTEAEELVLQPNYLGAAMLDLGEADTLVTGLRSNYGDALRPMLQVIKTLPDSPVAAGVYLIATRHEVLFFADAAVNIDPDAETLASIAMRTARLARDFDIEPRVAMLSFSDFGSVRDRRSDKVREAVEIVRQCQPDLIIDGEMSVQTALSAAALAARYPRCHLDRNANVLIFPSLEAGTAAWQLVHRLADAEVIGPILVGMRKAVHVVMRDAEVQDIVNLAAIGTVQALQREATEPQPEHI
jgi:malate dehydrogenase (oxaloacetate-decarboxylating)(NADP+)